MDVRELVRLILDREVGSERSLILRLTDSIEDPRTLGDSITPGSAAYNTINAQLMKNADRVEASTKAARTEPLYGPDGAEAADQAVLWLEDLKFGDRLHLRQASRATSSAAVRRRPASARHRQRDRGVLFRQKGAGQRPHQVV